MNRILRININNKVVNHTVKKRFFNTRCPKCNGNIFFEKAEIDAGKEYEELTGWCLQCGYTMYPKKIRMLAEELMSVSSDINNS